MTALGCADESLSGVLLDPDAVGADQGTLVSTSDIRSVAAFMVQSMSQQEGLARLRAEQRPLRILVGPFKQRTSIAIFDKDIFVNRMIGSLSEADSSRNYEFILRGRVPAEDAREMPAGADFVLTGEVRELLFREPVAGGGELERRTVQYSLAITRVSDSQIIWADSKEILKQQLTGALYR